MSKKMRVVSEDEYSQLLKKTNTMEHAKTHFFTDKDQEATSVFGSLISEDIKVQLYSSLMKRVNNQLKDILDKPISVRMVSGEDKSSIGKSNTISTNETPPPVTPSSTESTPVGSPEKFTLSESDIKMLKEFPTTQMNKAHNLLGFLKCHPEMIKWDKSGRVTFWGSEFEPDSNISDLMSYSIRDLKWTTSPNGINRFLRVCKMLNVPAALFSTVVRNDLMGTLDSIPLKQTATLSAHKLSSFSAWEPLNQNDALNKTFDPYRTPTGIPQRPRNTKDVTSRQKTSYGFPHDRMAFD